MSKSLIKNGQSLIEIVVAVGIIAVVLVGVSDLITRSLGSSSFQARKTAAVNIAQYQLNFFRQLKEREPKNFFTVNMQANYGVCDTTGIDFDQAKYECTVGLVPTMSGSEVVGALMEVNIKWTEGDKEINTTLNQELAKQTK